MGNIQSSNVSNKRLYKQLDFIAAEYILSQKFDDFLHLNNKEYCKNLVILTSDTISKYLKLHNIEFKNFKRKKNNDGSYTLKDDTKLTNINAAIIEKDDLKKYDIQDEERKKRLCDGISKYYLQINKIFGAIYTTFKPSYKERKSNDAINFQLKDGAFIQKEKKPRVQSGELFLNFCNRRIEALSTSFKDNIENPKQVKLKNKNLCRMGSNVRTLREEPGLKEYIKLYDNVWEHVNSDNRIGNWQKNRNNKQSDLKEFSKVFNNTSNTVGTFDDIKIKNRIMNCDSNIDFLINKNHKLLISYKNKISIMMKNMKKNRNKLKNILSQIFVIQMNPVTKKMGIRIHPNISFNEKLLKKLQLDTKNLIKNLYINCEKDYIDSTKIFNRMLQISKKNDNIEIKQEPGIEQPQYMQQQRQVQQQRQGQQDIIKQEQNIIPIQEANNKEQKDFIKKEKISQEQQYKQKMERAKRYGAEYIQKINIQDKTPIDLVNK